MVIQGGKVGKNSMRKKFNIFCDGYLWMVTDDINKAVRECKNMMVCGIEREAITIHNEYGNPINLQF